MSSNWIFCREEPDQETIKNREIAEKDKKISSLTIQNQELIAKLADLDTKYKSPIVRTSEVHEDTLS